jgi:hypothetical protein
MELTRQQLGSFNVFPAQQEVIARKLLQLLELQLTTFALLALIQMLVLTAAPSAVLEPFQALQVQLGA